MAAGRSDAKPHDWRDPDQIQARAARLKSAVKSAGGAGEVSRKASMSTATLGSYLAGRDMNASALVSLAAACGVSLVWLATGRGEILAPEGSVPSDHSVEMLKNNVKDEPANFHLLAVLVLTCREFYERSGLTPTLEMVLGFVSPHYISGHAFWQDKHFKIVDLDDAA